MFKKYRLCLILSGMAVVLVCSSLLFLEKGDEPPAGYAPKMIVETESSETQPETEMESDSDSVIEDAEKEEYRQKESTVVSEEEEEIPVPEKEPATEIQREEEQEVMPAETSTPEPVTVPTSESTPLPEVTPVPAPKLAPEDTPIQEPEEKEPEPEATSTPHEHSWMFDSWYQEPTCSNGGLVMEICAHCGETQVTGGTPTGEHSYQVETPGDCISEEVVVCSVCNCREVREKNPGNHIDVEDGFCYGCGKNAD